MPSMNYEDYTSLEKFAAQIPKEMEEFFHKRTAMHTSLVQKYIEKLMKSPIVDKYSLDLEILAEEAENHDILKYEEPELTPYIYLTWKKAKPGYTPTAEMLELINSATNHHISLSKHHPEYWSDEINEVNPRDRDAAPDKMVDATKIPLEFVGVMCCDWCAVSTEVGTQPIDWAKKNINVRWGMTEEQNNFTYEVLNEIWR